MIVGVCDFVDYQTLLFRMLLLDEVPRGGKLFDELSFKCGFDCCIIFIYHSLKMF